MYKTLIVVDDDDLAVTEDFPGAISFTTYLSEYPKLNEPKTRVINLCNSKQYLSKGYYCSLLAEAREHKVLPSVKAINGLRHKSESDVLVSFKLDPELTPAEGHSLTEILYFGKSQDERFQKLARQIYSRFPMPLLKLELTSGAQGIKLKVDQCGYSDLNEAQQTVFLGQLSNFVQTVWRSSSQKKRYRWDMAILVNPDEPSPPSDKEAIAKFVKAAAKHSIQAEPVTINQLHDIANFDALFIRETTAIDHYTYRLAAAAEAKDVVVIDDSTSILRCCNKVFLHDAFSYQKIPSLKTLVLQNALLPTIEQAEQQFGYPMILKTPEGSFSRGVYKVENREGLQQRLEELFASSALVLAQEYFYTDFDWRIGVLNGRAIYACRYEMARNHWQIYNHSSKKHSSGGFETLPTFEVPKHVLDVAVKSAKIIGNSLYGVDLKEAEGKAYVIEVNDNPSIDHGIEDRYLRDELYMQIMSEFSRRLEGRGR